MSLPWNKSVRLCIGANNVQGVLYAAWSPRRVLATCKHSTGQVFSNGSSSPPMASPVPFEAAMTATLSELGSVRSGRVKDAQILMADARVHFDVVPGDYADLSERQLQSVAQACLGEILGDRALGCVVRWDLQKNARHLVIAAIESSDVDLVEHLAREHGIERISVQPAFCWHWNQHASTLAQEVSVFVTVDEDHMIAALVVSGSITAFSSGSVQLPPLVPSDNSQQKNAIDDRVDRLLSSVGHDPSLVQSYLLVAPNGGGNRLDARWQVVDSNEELV